MTARVALQACGCIELPEEIARALQVSPGSMLQVDVTEPGALTLGRVSPRTEPQTAPKAACPLP